MEVLYHIRAYFVGICNGWFHFNMIYVGFHRTLPAASAETCDPTYLSDGASR